LHRKNQTFKKNPRYGWEVYSRWGERVLKANARVKTISFGRMPKPDGQQYVITFRKNFLKTMYCIQAIFRFLQVANVSLTNCFAFLDRSRWLHQEICS